MRSRRAVSIATRSRTPGHAPVHSIIATLAPMLLDALCGVHRVASTAACLVNAGTDMATGCSEKSCSTTACRSRRSQTPMTDSCGPCGAAGEGGQRAVCGDFGDNMHRICKKYPYLFSIINYMKTGCKIALSRAYPLDPSTQRFAAVHLKPKVRCFCVAAA